MLFQDTDEREIGVGSLIVVMLRHSRSAALLLFRPSRSLALIPGIAFPEINRPAVFDGPVGDFRNPAGLAHSTAGDERYQLAAVHLAGFATRDGVEVLLVRDDRFLGDRAASPVVIERREDSPQ